MATFIPGKGSQTKTRATKGELIAILGTIICAGLTALIMIQRIIDGW